LGLPIRHGRSNLTSKTGGRAQASPVTYSVDTTYDRALGLDWLSFETHTESVSAMEAVGKGIKRSGVAREELFVCC
jgi:hypothetical protein